MRFCVSLCVLLFYFFTTFETQAKTKSQIIEGSIGFTFQTPFDPVEGQDPSSILLGHLTYPIDTSQSLTLRTRYIQTVLVPIDNDNQGGWMDSDIFYSNKMYDLKGPKALGSNWGLNYSLGVTLPTSKSSQIAGLYAGYWGMLGFNFNYHRATFSFNNVLGFFDFKWDTADVGGLQYNEQLLLRQILAVRWMLDKHRKWSTGATFFYTTVQNTVMNIENAYLVLADVTVSVSRKLSASVTVGTSDRRTETTNLLSYDRMFVMLGLTVFI